MSGLKTEAPKIIPMDNNREIAIVREQTAKARCKPEVNKMRTGPEAKKAKTK